MTTAGAAATTAATATAEMRGGTTANRVVMAHGRCGSNPGGSRNADQHDGRIINGRVVQDDWAAASDDPRIAIPRAAPIQNAARGRVARA